MHVAGGLGGRKRREIDREREAVSQSVSSLGMMACIAVGGALGNNIVVVGAVFV